MADRDPSEKRTFSYEEAVALLPEIRRLTEEASREFEAVCAPAPGASGRDAAQAKLDQVVTDWARSMMERGLEVKGLWLVDFDNGSGYYCWHYPEPALQYYHSYEGGYRGRMRIQ